METLLHSLLQFRFLLGGIMGMVLPGTLLREDCRQESSHDSLYEGAQISYINPDISLSCAEELLVTGLYSRRSCSDPVGIHCEAYFGLEFICSWNFLAFSLHWWQRWDRANLMRSANPLF